MEDGEEVGLGDPAGFRARGVGPTLAACLELPDDALPDPVQPGDDAVLEGGDRRVVCAEEGGGADPDLLQRSAHDPRGEGLEVGDNFRELGHGPTRLICATPHQHW